MSISLQTMSNYVKEIAETGGAGKEQKEAVVSHWSQPPGQLSVSSSTTAREAVLGTVPDFAYQGQGIRISGVSPGSAAELAGLQANDVILQFNGQAVVSLQAYSDMLRAAAPGDEIEITVQRGEQTLNVSATLQAR